MRKVIIQFNDGTSQTFDTMEDAAKALGCVAPSLHRIMQGIAVRLQAKHGIKSVELLEPHGKPKGLRKHGGGRHPVLCECEATGESFICDSIQEAKERTKFSHAIHYFVDIGTFRFGWKFTSVAKTEKTVDFPRPVPKEILDALYGMAKTYASKKCFLRGEDLEEAVQEIVVRSASAYSKGKYEEYSRTHEMPLEIWLRLRVRKEGYNVVTKEGQWRGRKAELPENATSDLTHDAWIETLASTTDADMSFLDDIPEHLRPLAECLLHGLVATEIDKELGITDKCRQEMMRELRRWAREYFGR